MTANAGWLTVTELDRKDLPAFCREHGVHLSVRERPETSTSDVRYMVTTDDLMIQQLHIGEDGLLPVPIVGYGRSVRAALEQFCELASGHILFLRAVVPPHVDPSRSDLPPARMLNAPRLYLPADWLTNDGAMNLDTGTVNSPHGPG